MANKLERDIELLENRIQSLCDKVDRLKSENILLADHRDKLVEQNHKLIKRIADLEQEKFN